MGFELGGEILRDSVRESEKRERDVECLCEDEKGKMVPYSHTPLYIRIHIYIALTPQASKSWHIEPPNTYSHYIFHISNYKTLSLLKLNTGLYILPFLKKFRPEICKP